MKSKFAKTTIFLYLMYFLWYREAIGDSRILLYGGAILIAIATAVYINKRTIKQFRLPKGTWFNIAYGIFSLIIGILVALDVRVLTSSLMTYFALLFVCICICLICLGERSVDWLMHTIISVSILCAVYALTNGYGYYNGVIVTTMGPRNNPNTLGILMVFGMFGVAFQNKRDLHSMVIFSVLVTLFLYVIIKTGSKKALLSAAILLTIWIAAFMQELHKKGDIYQRIAIYILVFILLMGGIVYLKNGYLNSVSFSRMMTLTTSGSTQIRKGMYREAYEFFKRSPIFGIGYNQYRVFSRWQTYSHSTYAEILASGGFIGSMLYFAPIILTGVFLFKKLRRKASYEIKIIFALFCVELFLGTVNIFMYDFMHMMVWALLFMLSEKYHVFNTKGRKIDVKI